MKKRKTVMGLIVYLVLGLFLLVAGEAQAEVKKPDILTMLLCPFGCGTVEGNTIFGNMVAKSDLDLIIRPQETPGYMYNIREMGKNKRRWGNTVFGTEDDILNYAPLGGQEFFKEFLPKPIKEKFLLVYSDAWWTQGHWWVTLDPNLKTINDLKGKKLGVGMRSQSDWGLNARLDLEYGYGINMKNTKIYHLGPAKEVEELIDGKVDAIVMGAGTEPFLKQWLVAGPMRNLEASGRKIYYIGLDADVIDKLNKKFGTSYMAITIPPGTLPGQTEPLVVGADRGYYAAHHTLPDELAYKLVKAVMEFGKDMGEVHALWKIWSPELMVSGLTETNTHPGAIKAYKELGIWKFRKQYKPVKLWWENK
jgi:uncharacterized protein